jgi:hypothetical protein
MPPLKLTQEQLDQVMVVASAVLPELRSQFLREVANNLAGVEVDDGSVYRACARAARAMRYLGLRETA